MAHDFYIDPDVNCIFVRHFDEMRVGEGFDSIMVLLADPEFHRGLNILRDTRQVSIPDIYADTRELINAREQMKSYAENFQSSRFAWVVGSAADYAIVHRWSATTRLDAHVERRPFRDMMKAKEWLGIPGDYEIRYPTDEKTD
ncbi:MAG: hypothetical protein QGH73_03265 [Rhodospirillales bacterium]|nr:hypothetical protein [Rhodospirillales bacterium]MDP6646129.1 hypothetical protein [Rhodospirillales bacterium]MDP6840678.1 hypothetical protein [Rhodospirillales bacterium]